MGELRIGYARVSTDEQDLAAQRDALLGNGRGARSRVCRSWADGDQPGAPRAATGSGGVPGGDTLVVTKLDRLARSLPDARAIADGLTAESIKFDLGGSVYDPTDPIGRLLFNMLAMVAEFEADLARMRTREGMKTAKRRAGCAASSPSSARGRKPTWWSYITPAGTRSAR